MLIIVAVDEKRLAKSTARDVNELSDSPPKIRSESGDSDEDNSHQPPVRQSDWYPTPHYAGLRLARETWPSGLPNVA